MLRRIDELGRIVIPKEIRKKMKIREGDNLDIFISNDEVILKKYSPLDDFSNLIDILILGFNKYENIVVVITDKEKVISSTHPDIKPDELLSDIFYNLLGKNEESNINKSTKLNITPAYKIESNFYLKPISVYGDLFGGVLIFYEKELSKNLINFISIIHHFCVTYLQI